MTAKLMHVAQYKHMFNVFNSGIKWKRKYFIYSFKDSVECIGPQVWGKNF